MRNQTINQIRTLFVVAATVFASNAWSATAISGPAVTAIAVGDRVTHAVTTVTVIIKLPTLPRVPKPCERDINGCPATS